MLVGGCCKSAVIVCAKRMIRLGMDGIIMVVPF